MRVTPQNRIVITVDGLAGTGKTTLSKLLSERLGFLHFSSGVLYRALGWLALQEQRNGSVEREALELLARHRIELSGRRENGGAAILVDGMDIGDALYEPEVSHLTSVLAQHPKLREHLVPVQRGAFPGMNLVAEGRDMGTVIFPDADLKFFIRVDEKVAVGRRLKQMVERSGATDENEIERLKEMMKIELLERDRRDETRAVAPTRPAEDAIIIDNSSETLTVVVETMYHHAFARGLVPERN